MKSICKLEVWESWWCSDSPNSKAWESGKPIVQILIWIRVPKYQKFRLWYWMVCLENEQRSFCRFWDCIQLLHFGLFCWPWWPLHFIWGIPALSPSILLQMALFILLYGWVIFHSKNNTQLWMWLVIEARSDAVKSNIALEPGMSGPWITANWKWSNRRWQEWMSTF